MEYATLIVLLALLQFLHFTFRVGLARGKYKIHAPACSGNDTFERIFRVQQNTMEQLVVLIPATYAFAFYVSPVWVLLPGAAYLVGRAIYSAEYIKEPSSRTPGVGLTMAGTVALVVGALVGVILALF